MIPETLYDIRPGMRGRTAEWGRVQVLHKRNAIVTFQGSGGRGRSSIFETNRSILFHNTKWETES